MASRDSVGSAAVGPAAKVDRRHRPSPWVRSRPLRRSALVLLLAAGSACQASVHGRRPLTQVSRSENGMSAPSGVPRQLSVGQYALSGFRGTEATRRWPLMDSRTRSHRYEFALDASGSGSWSARCQLMTITGDEARDRARLECDLLDGAEGGPAWRLELAGRYEVGGVLHGPAQHYRVEYAEARAILAAGGMGDGPGYLVFHGEALMAKIELRGRGKVWIEPGLSENERGAMATTIFALLILRELRRASA